MHNAELKLILIRQLHGRRGNNHSYYTHEITAAADPLSILYDYYGSIHNTRYLIDVLILQSLSYDSRGDEMIALEKLAESIALAEPGGFIRPFLDAGPQMAKLQMR